MLNERRNEENEAAVEGQFAVMVASEYEYNKLFMSHNLRDALCDETRKRGFARTSQMDELRN